MVDERNASREEASLADFLAPGVIAEDIPELFPLFAAKKLLAAFTALFSGGENAVMARLLVLREIGSRGDAPLWSPAELKARFAYVDPIKLDTILSRLKDHDLLVWNSDSRLYQVSSAGRIALAAIDHVLKFSGDDDAELGFITSQIAAGASVGRLGSEHLRHLLARLTELENKFSLAVQSGSEYQLLQAQKNLESVWNWMEKGTEVMASLTADGLPDTASWRLAQEIGSRQARIMRMTGVFQRELSAIAKQRVHLSQGGLTSSELANWLRGQNVDTLYPLAKDMLSIVPEPVFVLPDVMLDVAEFELCERVREAARASTLPPPAEVEITEETARELPRELPQLLRLLSGIEQPLSLMDIVVGGDYRQAAYRLSLLPLIGEHAPDAELAAFAALCIKLDMSDELQTIGQDGIAAISVGTITPEIHHG